jgi:hypothetical protein
MKKTILMLSAYLAVFAAVADCGTIQIQYQVGAGPLVTCDSVSPAPVSCANVAGPPLQITLLGATSNNPGTSTLADLLSANVDLDNLSSTSQTIQIQISADQFTMPVGPNIALLSHVGGTVVVGTSGSTMSYQSCVNSADVLATVNPLGSTCVAGAFASGLSTPPVVSAGSFSNDKSAVIPSLSAPYSIDEAFTITLAAGEDLNWSASTSLTTSATVEPASILLAIAGLGLIFVRRNRGLYLRSN